MNAATVRSQVLARRDLRIVSDAFYDDDNEFNPFLASNPYVFSPTVCSTPPADIPRDTTTSRQTPSRLSSRASTEPTIDSFLPRAMSEEFTQARRARQAPATSSSGSLKVSLLKSKAQALCGSPLTRSTTTRRDRPSPINSPDSVTRCSSPLHLRGPATQNPSSSGTIPRTFDSRCASPLVRRVSPRPASGAVGGRKGDDVAVDDDVLDLSHEIAPGVAYRALGSRRDSIVSLDRIEESEDEREF